MMMPKRVSDRLARGIGKFQQVLSAAKDRDVNEADTVSIVKDMLAEVFGYDKYAEVTSEFAIRGTYCDLAIKTDNKVEYLIEVKAIGLELKESHLRQALDYGANNGVQWIIVTNGMAWQVHKLKFEQPIGYDQVCSFVFSELNPKSEDDLQRLFVVCKEGLIKDAREEFHERMQTVNRFLLGALLLSEEVLAAIRRELRKVTEGVLVSTEEIANVLAADVLKREVQEGEEAETAQHRVRRYYGKLAKKAKDVAGTDGASAQQELPIGPAATDDGTAAAGQTGEVAA